MAESAEAGGKVMEIIMKRLKDHFSTSWADLQNILPPYAPKKDEFLLIVFGH